MTRLPPLTTGPHEVWHRPPGGRWTLHGVYPSRSAAWDVAFDLPKGAIRVSPARDPQAGDSQTKTFRGTPAPGVSADSDRRSKQMCGDRTDGQHG